MPTNHWLRTLWIAAFAFLLAAGMGFAQDSAEPSPDGAAAAGGTSSSADAAPQDKTVISPADATNVTPLPGTQIKQVGTPFPLGMDPGGYRVGPVHFLDISTSAFCDIATPTGQSAQEFWGTSVGTNFVYTRPVNNGMLAVQGNPVISVSDGTPYVNVTGSISFTKQVTARWSMSAFAQTTFYQNTYLLQTPQYLLAYAAGGVVLQNLYAQHTGSTMYESNGFSMNYLMSGKTQLSLTPNVGLSYADVVGKSYLLGQIGGGATLTHSFTPYRSAFVYGTVTRSYSTAPVNTPVINALDTGNISNWNIYSVGVGLNQKIGQSWYFTGSIGTSLQQGLNSSWTPTGSATIMKTMRRGTLSAAYTRTEAAQVLLSSGYFDQADLAYVTRINSRVSASLGLGAFRSVDTGSSERGKRAYANISYRWIRNLAWQFGYSFSSQNGAQRSLYSGDTSYFSVGLNWVLGHPTAN
jgi:hypothetical protein